MVWCSADDGKQEKGNDHKKGAFSGKLPSQEVLSRGSHFWMVQLKLVVNLFQSLILTQCQERKNSNGVTHYLFH